MKDKIRDLIISGTYCIPKLLLSNYKELNITESESFSLSKYINNISSDSVILSSL